MIPRPEGTMRTGNRRRKNCHPGGKQLLARTPGTSREGEENHFRFFMVPKGPIKEPSNLERAFHWPCPSGSNRHRS